MIGVGWRPCVPNFLQSCAGNNLHDWCGLKIFLTSCFSNFSKKQSAWLVWVEDPCRREILAAGWRNNLHDWCGLKMACCPAQIGLGGETICMIGVGWRHVLLWIISLIHAKQSAWLVWVEENGGVSTDMQSYGNNLHDWCGLKMYCHSSASSAGRKQSVWLVWVEEQGIGTISSTLKETICMIGVGWRNSLRLSRLYDNGNNLHDWCGLKT